MKLFWILASIITLSVTGFIGMQGVDAIECINPNHCEPRNNFAPLDKYGNSMYTLTPNEPYKFQYHLQNILWTFNPCTEYETRDAISLGEYNKTEPVERCVSGSGWVPDDRINDHSPSPVLLILQVKNEKKMSEHIELIEDTIPPNDAKTFELYWTPTKNGEYDVTLHILKSFDDMIPLKPAISRTVTVTSNNDSQHEFHVQQVDFLENPKEFDSYEFLWGEFLISKFNSAELYRQTSNPSYYEDSISHLSSDENHQLISILDDLLEHSEAQTYHRKYNIVHDEKYFIITIVSCGGPCPLLD